MDHFTIRGHQFEIPTRYVEGHECLASEANKLQQAYKAVLSVWTRKKLETAESIDEVQAELDAYAVKYAFGQRGGFQRKPKDPVAIRAFEIAQRHVRERIKQAGGRLKDVKQGKINAKARAWVADPSRGYMEEARKQLKKGDQRSQMSFEDVADLIR